MFFWGDCDRVEWLPVCIEEISVNIDEKWVGSKPLDVRILAYGREE